MVSILWGIFF